MLDVKNIPLHGRRIIMIAYDDSKLKQRKIDWSKIFISEEDVSFYKSLLNIKKDSSDSRSIIKKFKDKFHNEVKDGFAYYFKEKRLPFVICKIDDVINNFKFPPQHPKNGFVYACSDVEPDLYLPLSMFHSYMYQSKLSAFNELCSALGAKTCRVISVEENGKIITNNIEIDKIPSKLGLLSSKLTLKTTKKTNSESIVYLELPKPNKIKSYESLWLDSEPTWKSLQKIRLNNDLLKYTVDLNYTDEMGVDTKLAASINSIGGNIGGTFTGITKVMYRFEVEFWPKDQIL
ncbi:hypothetical protein [Chryseobacterium arthrosphaerae]|uniref:hypothetical protein n=1 Tax=Chryseobacterium arthrosphaerae TaxID=651561 RepID=UPI0031D39D7B